MRQKLKIYCRTPDYTGGKCKLHQLCDHDFGVPQYAELSNLTQYLTSVKQKSISLIRSRLVPEARKAMFKLAFFQ